MDKIMTREQAVNHIKKTLKELDYFCQDNKMQSSRSFGGGCESNSIMELKEGEVMFSEVATTRSYSTLGFSVTIYDTDKGDHVKPLSNNICDNLNQLLDE